ncbi:hypothetical protein ERO13_D05G115900v2 [Gossypium hirsutum]|uniref:RING-type E3 ubiquitin transferase n=1 Tax=Gossypium hirsutum TaxID=3635 RepID=A0ABM3A3V2_GOSHI|nr:U-box domain-containing protein 52-like [Gossypium hirsutum]KAG4145795.1 hypothetical protein ERO13_D05G115900v2 [Gossypium hirsutum]
MWHPKGHSTVSKKGGGGGNGLVAVAIDKDKGSLHAFRWAVEQLLSKSQTVVLIHVNKPSAGVNGASNGHVSEPGTNKQMKDKLSRELFLTFHCFCTRKDIRSLDIILEGSDIVKALTEYVSYAAIEKLVLGAPSRSGFMRKFRADIPTCVLKTSPDFCTVYVVSKGKVSSVRNAVRSVPFASPLLDQIKKPESVSPGYSLSKISQNSATSQGKGADGRSMTKPRISTDSNARSPIYGPRASLQKMFGDLPESDTDISFVSSDRASTDRSSSSFFDSFLDSRRLSNSTEQSLGSMRLGMRWPDRSSPHESLSGYDSGRSSCSSQHPDEVEVEMRRLRQELKQTMDLYGNACREALTAKQQAMELKQTQNQDRKKLEEVRQAEEAATSAVEKEKARCQAAIEAALAAQKEAELKGRTVAGGEILRETAEMKRMLEILSQGNVKYRRYTIEEVEEATNNFALSRKIGEGGYGPVFKCNLDHTPVAVKVLRPDAAQGRLQFLQEIEVLSSMRHPNMVLLLGACPEYGILVYEYMGRGSLDDCLFRKGNHHQALSWQHRFRIAAEIGTGLLFLHQRKPEPIVHRDLKPGNILLDQNYVSKISDVGLAKLVPQAAENMTQCCVTSAAGTFCYIDPEYQQTGMLGVKSDLYSLGIILLQLITARPPMGLAHYVEQAIERGTFHEMLDPLVPDWPAEETLSLAKLALRCAELRRRDRPDLGKDVLPELCRLREIAEEKMTGSFYAASPM